MALWSMFSNVNMNDLIYNAWIGLVGLSSRTASMTWPNSSQFVFLLVYPTLVEFNLLEGTPGRSENHTQIRRTRCNRRLRTYSSARCPAEEPTLFKASRPTECSSHSDPEWQAEKSQENKRWTARWRGNSKKTASGQNPQSQRHGGKLTWKCVVMSPTSIFRLLHVRRSPVKLGPTTPLPRTTK